MYQAVIEAKSARQWTNTDLQTFRVDMVNMEPEDFFGCEINDLPIPDLTQTLIEGLMDINLMKPGPRPTTIYLADFVHMIEDVSTRDTKHTVNFFAKDVMLHLGYTKINEDKFAKLVLQPLTYFTMCGGQVGARPDIALVDAQALLCLFVKDNRVGSSRKKEVWPHAQVVAHALGAYSVNINEARAEAQEKRELDPAIADHLLFRKDFDMVKVIPAFSLIGSSPCFYIIPITASFATAVACGQRPPYRTKVFYCEAPIDLKFLGMMPNDQRVTIFRMFEAFKQFIPTSFNELCRFDEILNKSPIPQPISPKFNSNVWTLVAEWFTKDQAIHTIDTHEPIDYVEYGNALGIAPESG